MAWVCPQCDEHRGHCQCRDLQGHYPISECLQVSPRSSCNLQEQLLRAAGTVPVPA